MLLALAELISGKQGTMDRAYYKALEAAPDADAVFVKCFDVESSGIPLIYGTIAATCRGKALQLKPDAR